MPILPVVRVGRIRVAPGTDVCPCIHIPCLCIEVEIHGRCVGVTDINITEIRMRHGGRNDIPRLVLLSAVGPLIDVVALRGISVGEREHLARCLVHNLVAAIDRFDGYALAIIDVDEAFGIGLSVLVTATGSAGHGLCVFVEWTFAVEVGQTVARLEGEGRGHAAALGLSEEGFHPSVGIVLHHRGCAPLRGALLVGNLTSVGQGDGIFAAGHAVEAPPCAGLAAIVGAYHRLHHVVHLVGNEAFAVILGRNPKVLVVVERVVAQLVGVGKVDVVLHSAVPRRCVVGIQRRGTIDLACKDRLLLHQAGNGTVVRRVARIGALVVGLVERCHGIDSVAFRNDVVGCADTVGHIPVALIRVPRRSAAGLAHICAVVADATEQEDVLDTGYLSICQFGVKRCFLRIGQRRIAAAPASRKSDTGNAVAFFGNGSVVVAHLITEEVPAPASTADHERQFGAGVRNVKGHVHGPCAGLEGAARRCRLLCVCKDWHHRQQCNHDSDSFHTTKRLMLRLIGE